jgi:hypothetical protein
MSWNKCPGCSTVSIGTDAYCPKCGEHWTIACHNCGLTWRFWEGYKYCPRCGVEAKKWELAVLTRSSS